ncbi:hypothetical protein AB0M45_09310 [Nocardia sp. NPDC051787]|uniref:hypothetical protein n=1 Tax=Nocardia sp. NPDC051787 TaxID=3155415 RepID=UPI00341E14DA
MSSESTPTPDPTAPPASGEPAPEPPDQPPAPAPSEADNLDPVQLSTVITELRQELEQARAGAETAVEQAAQQAREVMVQEIGRALGLVPDEDADPDQVIAELTERASASDRKLRDYRIKDAIAAAADTHNGDHALLVPYLRGTGALDDLDPDAPDFGTRIDSLVADAVSNNPKLTTTPAAPRSGGDFSAGNATPPAPADDEDIDAIRLKVRSSIASSRT